MNRVVEMRVQDGVATLTVNNPPVNALSAGVPEGLSAAIRSAESSLHELLLQIEDCSKPVVMAIHGTVLGGGSELAMAGHYRVAVASAQLGQPEVNPGIIPGVEGTQRLPRLVGIEKAIEMCVTGKPITAENARIAGLVDAVLEADLALYAAEYARQAAARGSSHPKTRERKVELRRVHALEEALAEGRKLAGKVKKRLLAPLKADPSFPWQDEAISICLHKPNVYIDLSGWSPKYFSPTLVQYANSRLRSNVLFGSDYPFITPDRWLADFAKISIRDDVRPLIVKENAIKLLQLNEKRA